MMTLVNAASSLTVPAGTEPKEDKQPTAVEPRKDVTEDDAPMSFPQKVSQLREGKARLLDCLLASNAIVSFTNERHAFGPITFPGTAITLSWRQRMYIHSNDVLSHPFFLSIAYANPFRRRKCRCH